MSLDRIVVVGGSIAATTAVLTLRAEGYEGQLSLLSDEARPPYTRVPLSKGVLAGHESADALALGDLPDGVDLLLTTTAVALDVEARLVMTTAGPVPFDGLVIATGARARRLAEPGQEEFLLRSYDDGVALREQLSSATSVVVVGGGVLGMEVASTCRALGRRVTVVDLLPPMVRLLGPVVGRTLTQIARTAGVRVVLSPGGVRLVGCPRPGAVQTSSGELITADLIVSAVGDVPNVEWLSTSGLEIAGGVRLDERCQVAENITAAGDVAVIGEGPRTPTWTSAVEQGRAAALTLLHGGDAPPLRPSQYAWTEQFGLDIKIVGAPGPLGEPRLIEGDLAGRSALLAWPDDEAPSTVMSFGHGTTVGQLKRQLQPR